ncbi:MAG: hypothetical protein OER04_12355 [Cyclobacteriaceae bacterium]|nr:hypothetical protein [Cyclobacteriaceae bacterium]
MKRIKILSVVGVCWIILAAVPAWNPSDIQVDDQDAVVNRGLAWLAAAQQEDGSWGAGSHARQDIRDPGAVAGDPATTAFAGLALIRAGSDLNSGPYRQQVRKAAKYLMGVVDGSDYNSAQITEIQGTQPQVKLGQNIDVAITAQFLGRVLSEAKGDAMESSVKRSLQTCIRKLEMSQQGNGGWSGGGWAGVLQSAAAFNALESARVQGLDTDDAVFNKAKKYQTDNVVVSGSAAPDIKTDDAAGIQLYTIAGNQRATARDARKAEQMVEKARKEGRLQRGATVSKETLKELQMSEDEAEYLAEAYEKNRTTTRQLQDESVLAGFGNNGGEEFLSYMLTSESLIITGGEAWNEWDIGMGDRLSKIQNNDGSWSGHHCITSPVFCTAAALLTLTTQRDEELLVAEK